MDNILFLGDSTDSLDESADLNEKHSPVLEGSNRLSVPETDTPSPPNTAPTETGTSVTEDGIVVSLSVPATAVETGRQTSSNSVTVPVEVHSLPSTSTSASQWNTPSADTDYEQGAAHPEARTPSTSSSLSTDGYVTADEGPDISGEIRQAATEKRRTYKNSYNWTPSGDQDSSSPDERNVESPPSDPYVLAGTLNFETSVLEARIERCLMLVKAFGLIQSVAGALILSKKRELYIPVLVFCIIAGVCNIACFSGNHTLNFYLMTIRQMQVLVMTRIGAIFCVAGVNAVVLVLSGSYLKSLTWFNLFSGNHVCEILLTSTSGLIILVLVGILVDLIRIQSMIRCALQTTTLDRLYIRITKYFNLHNFTKAPTFPDTEASRKRMKKRLSVVGRRSSNRLLQPSTVIHSLGDVTIPFEDIHSLVPKLAWWIRIYLVSSLLLKYSALVELTCSVLLLDGDLLNGTLPSNISVMSIARKEGVLIGVSLVGSVLCLAMGLLSVCIYRTQHIAKCLAWQTTLFLMAFCGQLPVVGFVLYAQFGGILNEIDRCGAFAIEGRTGLYLSITVSGSVCLFLSGLGAYSVRRCKKMMILTVSPLVASARTTAATGNRLEARNARSLERTFGRPSTVPPRPRSQRRPSL